MPGHFSFPRGVSHSAKPARLFLATGRDFEAVLILLSLSNTVTHTHTAVTNYGGMEKTAGRKDGSYESTLNC